MRKPQMFFPCSFWFVAICWLGLPVSHSSKFKANTTMSDTLNELFKNHRYDPRIRPNIDGPPVCVTTGFWVLSIDSVSVTDMAFGLDIFLRQDWEDKRLDHGLNTTLSLSNTILSNLWLPDSYFKNAKKSNFHEVTAKNLMIRIGPKGKVHYNTRVTLKASCIMDLRLYPFDVQYCPLIMESYGYSVDHITYKWEVKEGDGMMFVPSDVKILPQFRLVDLRLSSQYTKYIIGNWSGVVANFTFERTYSFYVIHIYGPSALIVVLSWISFLLPREQAPARVTLGVTSVLTEVTILTMSNHAMPRVNYVKAIDKYLITCFLFVFASLVEYSLILTLANRQQRHEKHKRENRKQNKTINSSAMKAENGDIAKRQISEDICVFHRRIDKIKSVQNMRGSSRSVLNTPQQENCDTSACHELKHCLYRDEIITSVDELSRKLFPLSFIVFNLYYWFCVFYYPYLIISKQQSV